MRSLLEASDMTTVLIIDDDRAIHRTVALQLAADGLKVLSAHEPTRAHMAIKVRHLGEAMRVLQQKGFDFEPVKDFGRVKAVFLKQTDPAGNKVHFLYLALS